MTMKHIFFHIVFSVLMLSCLVSCQQESLVLSRNSGVKLTFEASREADPDTKAQISEENATEILWSVGDYISVYYGLSPSKSYGNAFASTATEPSLTTEFSGTIDNLPGTQEDYAESDSFFGVYPSGVSYTENGNLILSASRLASQSAQANNFPFRSFYAIGRSAGMKMPFYNVLGGIRFTLDQEGVTEIILKGNNDEVLCGDFAVALSEQGIPTVKRFDTLVREIHITSPNKQYFSPGVPYFLVMLPTTFEKGFTVTFKKDEWATGTRRIDSKVEIKRSEFALLSHADKNVSYKLDITPSSNRLYDAFRLFFNSETGYAFSNYGTDEFMVAGDPTNAMWNDYDDRLGPVISQVNGSTVKSNALWDPYFQYIGFANAILDYEEDLLARSDTEILLGEAYFVRAFCYLSLVSQYGDLPLVLAPVWAPSGEYTRASKEQIFSLIINDLEKSYQLLPADASVAVRHSVSRFAAAHYLAKAHLWRASEINDDWNTPYKEDDLKNTIKYAEEVIGVHPLAKDFNDLFGNFNGYDSPITETNSEIVLSIDFDETSTSSESARGNMGLSIFTARYQNFPLMKRDIAGAREYQRMKTTPKYAYFLYDLENDSRFWKSFKTTYAVNNAAASKIYVQGTEYVANEYFPSNDGVYMSAMYIINRQDYGQKYYKNEVNAFSYPFTSSYTRQDYRTGKFIPTLIALYIYDEADNVVGTSMTPDSNPLLPPLSKYLDGAVKAVNRASGYRDGILARSAEDYFFKAEALIRQGNINQGLAALKPLRDRAQFKAGEKRDAYVDGGNAYHYNTYKPYLNGYAANCAFYPMNSYYYSLGGWDDEAVRKATDARPSELPVVTKGNYPKEDLAIMEKLGYSSDFDKAMCYLLNEKSREMYGEYLRWMDLARTKTLEKRLYFNDQAYGNPLTDITGRVSGIDGYQYVSRNNTGGFQPNKHYYRPIPLSFLDKLTKEGKPLSESEKAELQNPGY